MMEALKNYLISCKPLLDGDFNRGYICGVAVVLGVVILLLILKIIWMLIFRTHRCKILTIPAPDGDVLVAQVAISGAVQAALRSFPALQVRDVRVYRKRKRYFLDLSGAFDASGSMNFPSELASVKKAVFQTLEQTFGITNVNAIRIRLEKLSGVPHPLTPAEMDAEQEAAQAAEVAGNSGPAPMGGTPC